MISDAKMRAHLLSAIHGLRNSNTGWVPIAERSDGSPVRGRALWLGTLFG